MSCPSSGVASVALVTLSLGSRPFVQYTKPLMEAYAKSIGVSFHSVDSYAHDAMQGIPKNLSTRFLKLPLLEHFLRRYKRVIYVDDDVLIGPAAASLTALTPCHSLGATLERHKPAGWHTLHRRAACDLYHSPNNAVWCSGGGNQLIFNSGVMVLSRDAHLPHLARWRGEKLVCRVLCDQLCVDFPVARVRCTRQLCLWYSCSDRAPYQPPTATLQSTTTVVTFPESPRVAPRAIPRRSPRLSPEARR